MHTDTMSLSTLLWHTQVLSVACWLSADAVQRHVITHVKQHLQRSCAIGASCAFRVVWCSHVMPDCKAFTNIHLWDVHSHADMCNCT